jgi:hypothetical protein
MKRIIQFLFCSSRMLCFNGNADELPASLTPPESPSPRIYGPSVFGVRSGSAFLYTIPTTGNRPMQFSAAGLPRGVTLDAGSGQIIGKLKQKGAYQIVFMKSLEDGSVALGFFNRGEELEKVNFNKLISVGLSGIYHIRDLWRQKNLVDAQDALKLSIQPHGVVLLKLTQIK